MSTPKSSDIRRVAVAAKRASLDTLEAEAQRRGIPLSAVVVEAIDEKARTLCAFGPSLGTVRSTDGRSAAELTSEPIARPPY